MRVGELETRGFRRHAIRTALANGRLFRPQRGWVAVFDADPQLVFAVRRGVILSCITVARRRGLWQRHQETALHVAARSPSSHADVGSHHMHWGKPVRMREPHTIEDSVENALAYIASCQPFEEALAIWESALKKGVVTKERLACLPLGAQANRLLEAATLFADSGLESYVRHRLRALGLQIVAQAWVLGHRVDFLIAGWIVLQVDGSTHTGRQRDSDNRHDALLQLNNYLVIRVGYWQVMNEWPEVQHAVMNAVSSVRRRGPAARASESHSGG